MSITDKIAYYIYTIQGFRRSQHKQQSKICQNQFNNKIFIQANSRLKTY